MKDLLVVEPDFAWLCGKVASAPDLERCLPIVESDESSTLRRLLPGVLAYPTRLEDYEIPSVKGEGVHPLALPIVELSPNENTAILAVPWHSGRLRRCRLKLFNGETPPLGAVIEYRLGDWRFYEVMDGTHRTVAALEQGLGMRMVLEGSVVVHPDLYVLEMLPQAHPKYARLWRHCQGETFQLVSLVSEAEFLIMLRAFKVKVAPQEQVPSRGVNDDTLDRVMEQLEAREGA